MWPIFRKFSIREENEKLTLANTWLEWFYYLQIKAASQNEKDLDKLPFRFLLFFIVLVAASELVDISINNDKFIERIEQIKASIREKLFNCILKENISSKESALIEKIKSIKTSPLDWNLYLLELVVIIKDIIKFDESLISNHRNQKILQSFIDMISVASLSQLVESIAKLKEAIVKALFENTEKKEETKFIKGLKDACNKFFPSLMISSSIPLDKTIVNISNSLEQTDGSSKQDGDRSWHFNAELKTSLSIDVNKAQLISASPQDIENVIKHYQHHPVLNMDIKNIRIIYHPIMNRSFALRMALLNSRDKNPAFTPGWSKKFEPSNYKTKRSETALLAETLAKPYNDSDYPAVKLLPLWHGTKQAALKSLLETGYASLGTTDNGFFGKGIYSAHEAEYAYRVYGQDGVLIMNWVSFFSAYPVIDGDMAELQAKSNYQNYDAHFAPVISPNSYSQGSIYYPCKPEQIHKYIEMVVFESAQCLPRYLLELQPKMTKQINLKIDKNVEKELLSSSKSTIFTKPQDTDSFKIDSIKNSSTKL